MLSRGMMKGGITSGAIHVASDAVAQGLETRGVAYSMDEYDFRRTQRFGLLGLTLHGPYFFLVFFFLEKITVPRVISSIGAGF